MNAGEEELVDVIASRLAEIELRNFASRLGLTNHKINSIDHDLLVKSVSCIDNLSWNEDEKSSRLAVLMISIIWEYSSTDVQAALRERFILCLSRLGLSPTASMIDPGYGEDGKYSGFDNFRAELAAVALQIQYSEVIDGTEFLLTKFQKRVFSSIASSRLVGISAPTSAGKSFAIYLAIANFVRVYPGDSVVYIVPTVSLISQVTFDLRSIFMKVGIDHARVSGSPRASDGRPVVAVLTQERALTELLFKSSRAPLGMLVVDEVQNLERVGTDDELRSKILFDVLTDLSSRSSLKRIVISGPRLEGVGKLASSVFGGEACEVSANDSPVASLTYSVSTSDGKAFLRQHRDVLSKQTLQLEVLDSGISDWQGKSQYSDAFLEFLGRTVSSLGGDSQNIVFSPTTAQSAKTAVSLGQTSPVRTSAELASLSTYLARSVHPQYSLTELVKRGVAYHTGKVPPHARFCIEWAFRDGSIRNIVCTTTLMQGVNLPANIVFIRNPKLYVKGGAGSSSPMLSAYDFANLRGRAGRLMKDLVGRTVVLDEDSFAEHRDGSSDLFEEARKSLSPGYGDLFETNRSAVLAELRRPGTVVEGSAKFVATHIRQAVMRHGRAASERLSAVGIEITAAQFASVLSSIEALDVDLKICLENRYWDPFDLKLLKDNFESSGIADIPDTVWGRDLASTLKDWLDFHAIVAPYYFHRYLRSVTTDAFRFAVAKTAETWCRETPLRKIIDGRHFPAGASSEIDNQVSLINKQVVFGLPALLKPLTEIRGRGGSVLAAVEHGVFHPVSTFLMSQGLFRETTVDLRLSLLPDLGSNVSGVESETLSRIKLAQNQLDPWVGRQVSTFLNI